MKKLLLFLSVAVLIISLSITAFAHSGRTDKNGGHNDNIHGGYHYHCGGHPAHQHPNGVCPYDTGANANVNSKDTVTTKKSTPKTTIATTQTTTETTTETTAKATTTTTAKYKEPTTNTTESNQTDNEASSGKSIMGFIIVAACTAIGFICFKIKKK